ncbi:MAG: hypothetical protein JWN44_7015 [Myxococcales bacterium]|nr:hypothetical protein [Myxococcales bacterium]
MEKMTGSKAPNGNFAQQAEDIGDQAMQQLDHLREQASEVGERVVSFIKERPGTSLIIAAAAGYLIGRIVRS